MEHGELIFAEARGGKKPGWALIPFLGNVMGAPQAVSGPIDARSHPLSQQGHRVTLVYLGSEGLIQLTLWQDPHFPCVWGPPVELSRC